MSEQAAAEQEPPTPAPPPPPEAPESQDPPETPETPPETTIAQGGDNEAEQEKAEAEAKPYWPEDWAEKAAKHFAGDDEKAYKRELKRLERIKDPAALYGMYRDAEGKLTSGKLIARPDDKATDEEKTEFAKQLGWTDKPEEMLDQIKLDNEAVVGDADKPVLEDFTKAVHGATTASEFMNKAANWYFKNQEEQAAALDEGDDTFRRESEKALKDEMGSSFKRQTNAIASVFATAPGGTDVNNGSSLYARLMGGRMADGKIIGDDPDMVRWLVATAKEVNPSATVVDVADASGKSVDAEIKEIQKHMRDNKREYFKDEAMQQRYRELLSVREKIQARA